MREVFSSRFATILTMIGVAVGLGNVWRFPYMMGQYGGSAFLVVYLVFVLAFAIPATSAEWALGRYTRHGPLGAFEKAFGKTGRWIGFMLLATVLIANSYYVVVVANVAFTAGFGLLHGFSDTSIPRYEAGLANSALQAGIGLLVIAAAVWVLYRGLVQGIERISRLFVPVFGVVIIGLIVLAFRMPGAVPALAEFLRPDFSELTGTSVFAAMGQAFFSLSLGGTFYLIYGSYLRDDTNIPMTAVSTGLGDASAALLAALFIVPTTLVLGLDMKSGPLLIFETLPRMFAEIPAGRLLGSAFLIALWMMAFLSSLAAFQVIVGALTDSFGLSRGKAALLVGVADALLMLPSAIWPSIIGTLDLIFGSGMQVLGSGLTIIALFWGCGKFVAAAQIFGGRRSAARIVYLNWLRLAVPAALAIVLALYIMEAVS